MRRLAISVIAVCAAVSSFHVHAADSIPAAVTAAVNDPGRPWFERARDAVRKPAEIIAFSGIKPGDKIADLMPGPGYYTRVLSKLVGPKGKLYAVVPFATVGAPSERKGPVIKVDGQNIPLSRVEQAYALEDISEYGNITVLWEAFLQYDGQFALPEQVDAVFTADDYYELHGSKEFAAVDMAKVAKAIFRALKPGGVYVVMDHASAKGAGFTQAATLHRTDPEAVKAEIFAAGFVLDAESKLRASTTDDHSKLATDTEGVSPDEYIFRFKKPLDTPNTDKRPSPGSFASYYGNTAAGNYGAIGNVTGKRERRVFYHADGTYQEFGAPNTGNNPMQSGTFFWDADGHNCMLHQYPTDQRSYVVCHETQVNRHVGDRWTQDNGDGPGSLPYALLPGYQYFDQR